MIDAEQALQLLQTQVTKKGDGYIYKAEERPVPDAKVNCVYYEQDQTPSCIVGHILDDLNVDSKKITTEFNTKGLWLLNESSVNELNKELKLGLTPEAESVLTSAQIAQDNGHTWGEALIAAKEWYSELGHDKL